MQNNIHPLFYAFDNVCRVIFAPMRTILAQGEISMANLLRAQQIVQWLWYVWLGNERDM